MITEISYIRFCHYIADDFTQMKESDVNILKNIFSEHSPLYNSEYFNNFVIDKSGNGEIIALVCISNNSNMHVSITILDEYNALVSLDTYSKFDTYIRQYFIIDDLYEILNIIDQKNNDIENSYLRK